LEGLLCHQCELYNRDLEASGPGLRCLLPAMPKRSDSRLPQIQVVPAVGLGATGVLEGVASGLRPESTPPPRHRRRQGPSPPFYCRHRQGHHRGPGGPPLVGNREMCRCAGHPLPPTGRAVGIDLGVCAVIATSDGQLVTEGRYGRRGAEPLASAQMALAAKQRGSKRRARAVERVARAHRQIRNQRQDLAHRLSRALVNDYDLIVHEGLEIKNMVRRPKPRPNAEGGFDPNGAAAKAGLNRSIHDAGWGVILRMLAYKAEEAGREVFAVDPRNTSLRCSECGYTHEKHPGPLSLSGVRLRGTCRCECGHQHPMGR
jgi:hypothetical protein